MALDFMAGRGGVGWRGVVVAGGQLAVACWLTISWHTPLKLITVGSWILSHAQSTDKIGVHHFRLTQSRKTVFSAAFCPNYNPQG